MATYIFECGPCAHTESIQVAMEDRNEVKRCPECGEEAFKYNFMKTMHASKVALHEDIVTYMEKKMGRNPLFRPPSPSGKGVAGKTSGRPGAGRHFVGDPKHTQRWE